MHDYYKPEPREPRRRRLGQLNKYWKYRRRFGKHSEFIAMCYKKEGRDYAGSK